MQGSRQVTGWRHQDRSSCARRRSCPLPDPEPVRPSGGRRSVSNESMIGSTRNTMQMRSFTDIFIKHPVLAIVVNLMIVLAGWRALTTLPVQQYPKIESSSVIITTVYYGASAETVRGFLSTPITPGHIVEAGTILVALDVSVEDAELKAQEAQAALAKTVLDRRQNLNHEMATTQEEVDRARADLDVARAQITRTKAIIARKTIRAPFRARVGIADVHPGQYLNEGTLLTTLQGIDDAAHVDFTVAQQVAADLREGELVEVSAGTSAPVAAKIVALDSRIDPATRNAVVRARIEGAAHAASPGSSVRVRVPIGTPRKGV